MISALKCIRNIPKMNSHLSIYVFIDRMQNCLMSMVSLPDKRKSYFLTIIGLIENIGTVKSVLLL